MNLPFAQLAVVATALLVPACNTVGPSAVYGGRSAYAEAIAFTNHQQVFRLIVNARFQQASSLLAVSSVNASISVSGNVGGEAGIGASENFAGNLVPLSAGVSYEESPTITYTPVQGIDYLGEVLGPIPVEVALLALQGSHDAGAAAIILFKSVNGIRNPAYGDNEPTQADPRFERLAYVISKLYRAELVTLAANDQGETLLLLPMDFVAERAELREFLDLLGVRASPFASENLALPVRLAAGMPTAPELRIETRSIGDLIRIAAAAMEVPPEQLEAGFVIDTPSLGLVGREIDIRASPTPPSNALVSQKHRGQWYFIAADDIRSKSYFNLLENLVSARIADASNRNQAAPVLTLPVAR